MTFRKEERKSSFKKGLDACEGRRNRNETTINIRKSKREEGLAKRRNNTVMNFPTDKPSAPTTDEKRVYTAADIPELAAALSQPNIDAIKLTEVARGFRRMLSIENNPPAGAVLNSGVLPAFIQMLACHDKPDVQFEAAWVLTNIASTDYTKEVANAGAIPFLVALLSNSSAEIRDQAAWCLGNIAGDSTDLRDMVLVAGAMQPLIQNLMHPNNSTSNVNNFVWTLSNFCRGKPAPDLSLIAQAVPVLASILNSNTVSMEAKSDALWALSYITDGTDERIQAVVGCDGLVPCLVQFLSGTDSSIVTPALRAVGNIVTGNEKHTQAAIDAGLMKAMPLLLQHEKKAIRKEACWAMSNVAAGSEAQIQTCFKNGLCFVIELAHHDEYNIRKEALWVISNIATGGSPVQVMSLVEADAIPAICALLEINDSKMLLVALDAIQSILKVGSKEGKDYVSFVDENDGIMLIEALQEHESEEVYEKAIDIIEEFFGVEDGMENENLAPMTDGNMFAFGVPQKNLDVSVEGDAAGSTMLYNF